jgi:hypothetical protein
MSWRIGVRAFVAHGGRPRDREPRIGRGMRFRIARPDRRMAAGAPTFLFLLVVQIFLARAVGVHQWW